MRSEVVGRKGFMEVLSEKHRPKPRFLIDDGLFLSMEKIPLRNERGTKPDSKQGRYVDCMIVRSSFRS